MHVDDHSRRRAGLRQLLDADREGQGIQARTSVLAWDNDPHKARLDGGPDCLVGESMFAVDLGREGLDHAFRQLSHGGAKARVLRGEFEIQVKRYLE